MSGQLIVNGCDFRLEERQEGVAFVNWEGFGEVVNWFKEFV